MYCMSASGIFLCDLQYLLCPLCNISGCVCSAWKTVTTQLPFRRLTPMFALQSCRCNLFLCLLSPTSIEMPACLLHDFWILAWLISASPFSFVTTPSEMLPPLFFDAVLRECTHSKTLFIRTFSATFLRGSFFLLYLDVTIRVPKP